MYQTSFMDNRDKGDSLPDNQDPSNVGHWIGIEQPNL